VGSKQRCALIGQGLEKTTGMLQCKLPRLLCFHPNSDTIYRGLSGSILQYLVDRAYYTTNEAILQDGDRPPGEASGILTLRSKGLAPFHAEGGEKGCDSPYRAGNHTICQSSVFVRQPAAAGKPKAPPDRYWPEALSYTMQRPMPQRDPGVIYSDVGNRWTIGPRLALAQERRDVQVLGIHHTGRKLGNRHRPPRDLWFRGPGGDLAEHG
jgi:hypothetical protein